MARRPASGPARSGGNGIPDFLVIGHAVQDLLSEDNPAEWRLGGAAAYAAVLARNLGLRTAVFTAARPELDLSALLPGVDIAIVPGEKTTQIRNVYEGERRTQYIPQRARRLTADRLPPPWRKAPLVLLGPVAGEVDGALAQCFPAAYAGVGAQGWLRAIGRDGRVRPVLPEAWPAEGVLSHASALFVSDEDIPPKAAQAALQKWCGLVETVAFTRGYNGADICHRGDWRHIEAFPAQAMDPTGAGDVFAAAFLISYRETGDPWQAARFACCAASFVVEDEGISAVPDRSRIEQRLQRYPDIIAA